MACRWKQCSFLLSSSQWMLHKCVSPSDASPDGKWPVDCLKGNSDLMWQLQDASATTQANRRRLAAQKSPKSSCAKTPWRVYCSHSALTAEIPTDGIRYDAIWPYSLRPGGGRSPQATESVHRPFAPGALVVVRGRGGRPVGCNEWMENVRRLSSIRLI